MEEDEEEEEEEGGVLKLVEGGRKVEEVRSSQSTMDVSFSGSEVKERRSGLKGWYEKGGLLDEDSLVRMLGRRRERELKREGSRGTKGGRRPMRGLVGR